MGVLVVVMGLLLGVVMGLFVVVMGLLFGVVVRG